MKKAGRYVLSLLTISFVATIAHAQITRSLVEVPDHDTSRLDSISSFLGAQLDRRSLPEFKNEWFCFNHTPDMYGECGKYRKLGFLPHKTSRDMENVPVGIGFETLDRDTFDPLVTFDYLCEAGVKYARCQSGWWKCERVPGKYDFSWLDQVVDGLSERSIQTWLSLGFGHPEYCPCELFEQQWKEAEEKGTVVPGWGRGWVGEAPLYHGERAMKAWLKYVRALSKHFKGRVEIFEIWNEPEAFWRYKGERAGILYGDVQASRDFAQFVKATAAEIRKVIPSARITINLAELSSVWMTTLSREGIADVIDFYNYHVYWRTPEEGVQKAFNQARALLKRSDGNPMPIWQGESGRSTGKSRLFGFPTEYAQAKYIARRITYDIGIGCEVSSQFTVADFLSYYPDGSDQYYGIWNTRENKPKLGWYALQSMCYLMEDARPAPQYWFHFTSPQSYKTFTPLSSYMNVEVMQFSRRGIPLIAFWQKEHIDISPAPLPGMMEFVTDAPSLLPHPVVIDPVRGEVWDVSDALGYHRRGIQTLSLWAYDYPLFLTDLSFFSGGS